MLCPPQIPLLKPNPQNVLVFGGEAFRRSLSDEGKAFKMGLVPL